MNLLETGVAERYRVALEAHVRSPSEFSLMTAYEVGRQALEEGIGAIDLVLMHRDALIETLPRLFDHEEITEAVERSAGFLLECLSPFEMALTGFRRANEDLRTLSKSLERQVDERTRDLSRSVELLEQANAQRSALLRQLANAQEEEHKRIADGLHDDTIQAITAVAMRFATLRRQIDDPEIHGQLERLETTLSDVIARCRNLLFALRPVSLDREGLVAALSELLRRIAEEGEFSYEIEDEQPDAEIPGLTKILAYRIAQEALVNARKHASPSKVVVQLRRYDDGLQVRIVDDGQGFEPEMHSAPEPGHFGLASMHERANFAGGWLTIDSVPGGGTTVTFWLPDIADPEA